MDGRGFTWFTFEDLIRIKDVLSKKQDELKTHLEQLNSQLKEVSAALALNKHKDETLGVLLPKNFFELTNRREVARATSERFNWKRVAFDYITTHKELVTTEMIYEKAKVLYPTEIGGRTKAIRNFSSALHYLCAEGKIARYKESGFKEYLYGKLEFFELMCNKPKLEYMNKFKNQREGK